MQYVMITTNRTQNLMSTIHQGEHHARRRIFADVFSRSRIWKWSTEDAAASINRRLLTRICAAANSREVIDIHSLQCGYSLDMLQAYQFGCLGTQDYVSNTDERERCLDNYFVKSPYLFWISELPLLVAFSGWLRIDIVPKRILQCQDGLEASILESCKKAELLMSQNALESGAMPVYNQAHKGFQKTPGHHGLDIASDMLDFNAAALETTGDAVIWLYLHLSKDPEMQSELRNELLTLLPTMKFPSDAAFPGPKAVNDLPLLHAIVMETLRLHPAADGGQRRVVPSLSCRLHGHELPAGTVVHAYVYSIHRNPEVFPEPEKWNPRRWLDADPEQLREMNRWFRAFGSGSMQCIGKDFAVYCKYFLGD